MIQILCRFCMLVASAFALVAHAAAPDDISTNQRAWFDANDVDGDADYTDNPVDNSAISQWNDKSGSNNHILGTGTSLPLYKHNSLLPERHGIKFDGVDDRLIDQDDIWASSVDRSEIFLLTTTDRITNSSLFASASSNTSNRLSAHIPWGNSTTYFDHGLCCSPPARMYQTIPITLSANYLWHFSGSPTLQAIIRDSETLISDAGAGTYSLEPTSKFGLGSFAQGNTPHDGRIFEALYYQSTLNLAQKQIISSYLSAKWSTAFSATSDYSDNYDGDDTANGDYDFFVGGIGQNGGSQNTGTSQGLTITDNTFLNADGKFLLAGVNYMLAGPTTGTTTADLPTNYTTRSARSWYMDTTGSGGLVNLAFDANEIGIPLDNGSNYGLLYRSSTTGNFTQVASSTMASGKITFSHLPADGIYTVGKIISEVALDLVKSVSDSTPNIGDQIMFTLSVSNSGPAIAIGATVQDIVPAGFGNLTQVSHSAGTTFTITGNTIDWIGLDIPSGGTLTAVFSAQVMTP